MNNTEAVFSPVYRSMFVLAFLFVKYEPSSFFAKS